MKELTNSLLIVTLCFITLFSCGGNGSSASLDGGEKAGKLSERNNLSDKLSKEEVKDKMNKANNINQTDGATSQLSETEKLVANLKKQKTRRLGEDQAEQSTQEQIRRYEQVKDLPATEQQEQAANKVCNCLNKNPLFKTAKKSKSGKALIKSLGEDKDNEIRALQDCYNNIMVPAVKGHGKDAGIFSKKAREALNNNCLNGKNDFWIHIGDYLSRHNQSNNK